MEINKKVVSEVARWNFMTKQHIDILLNYLCEEHITNDRLNNLCNMGYLERFYFNDKPCFCLGDKAEIFRYPHSPQHTYVNIYHCLHVMDCVCYLFNQNLIPERMLTRWELLREENTEVEDKIYPDFVFTIDDKHYSFVIMDVLDLPEIEGKRMAATSNYSEKQIWYIPTKPDSVIFTLQHLALPYKNLTFMDIENILPNVEILEY